MIHTDQIGNTVIFDQIPKRIVSLVPSQTELLVDLGLNDQIVGVTKFCIHPRDLRSDKQVVGGTKQVHYDKIKVLRPDIILCNKEENTKEMVNVLHDIAPVHVSDVKTLSDAMALIKMYGELFEVDEKAKHIFQSIKQERKRFRESLTTHTHQIKVAYIIWKEPLMVAGSDTFINNLLKEVGFINIFETKEGRYPEIHANELEDADYVLLSSEPYPFTHLHKDFFEEVTQAKAILVNGEFFSWYGSRLTKSFQYFTKLLSVLDL